MHKETNMTLPHLELMGAVTGARLANNLIISLMEQAKIKLWTDSMITFAMDLQFGTKLETVCCKPSDQDLDAYESSFMVTHLIWSIPLTFP